MAIFQFHMQIIGRSEGRSVVAAAAYRSAEKIENHYTGTVEDYTKKNWVEYSEIMLPPNAPDDFKNREILWNSVETVEKGTRARLAREIEVALPIELSMEDNIHLIQNFVKDTFLSEGMIADVNIHNPPVTDETSIPLDKTGNHTNDTQEMTFRNPHAHILLTVRPVDEKGRWMPKTQKEYLCKRGNETGAFTAEEYMEAKNEGWQKQYQYWKDQKKIWLTPSEAFPQNLVRISKNPRSTPYGRRDKKMEYWNSTDAIIQYRKSWEAHVNQALELAGRPERVDCRSYEAQGVDTISGIHLGSHAAKNENSDRYRANEDIKTLNLKNKDIQESLDSIEKQISERNEQLYEELARQMGQLRGELIHFKYDLENLKELQASLNQGREKTRTSINRIKIARKKISEKDKVSIEKISHLEEEAQSKFPIWDKRSEEIQAALKTEQAAINFRQEYLSNLLKEEGFSDLQDFFQESQILVQMNAESERLDKSISLLEKQIEAHNQKFEKLCSYIPQDASLSISFQQKIHDWFEKYENSTTEHIKAAKGQLHMGRFHHALKRTDYALNHAFYLAGRTGYFLGRTKAVINELNENNLPIHHER